jgi:hypothetical protein
MQITPEMFGILCATAKVTPKMIDFIRGMQYKLVPGDEHYMNCFYDLDGMASGSARTERKSSIDLGGRGFRE